MLFNQNMSTNIEYVPFGILDPISVLYDGLYELVSTRAFFVASMSVRSPITVLCSTT